MITLCFRIGKRTFYSHFSVITSISWVLLHSRIYLHACDCGFTQSWQLGLGILLVAVMSQIGILTPDRSIAAVPCYSPEWKITFGVNGETNKIRVCSKITSWNDSIVKYIISYNCVSWKFHFIRWKTIEIRQIFQHLIDTPWYFDSSNLECVCQIQQLWLTE